MDFFPDFLILENFFGIVFAEEKVNKLNEGKQGFYVSGMLEHPHKFQKIDPKIDLICKSGNKLFLETIMSVELAKVNYLLLCASLEN